MEYTTERMIRCAGCWQKLPKSLLKGVGNQYVCKECLSIWNWTNNALLGEFVSNG